MSPAPTRSDSLRIRAALIAEARVMLREGGHPVALNALAHRAGVGVGTVYRHFPSSQELLEAIAFESLQELGAQIRQAAEEADAWAGFERVVRAQVRMEITHVGLREVLAAVANHSDTERVKAEMAALVDDVIDRARAEGLLHAPVTATDLRDMLCGVGYAAAITPDRAEQVAGLYVDVILRGMRADAHRSAAE
ncbi:MAG: TetR/AcrR family transcriptional regulator [Saccharothrix sp.]|nr:TetR/AcrR family transcriptional regulator [Saccharothrix sp.]